MGKEEEEMEEEGIFVPVLHFLIRDTFDPGNVFLSFSQILAVIISKRWDFYFYLLCLSVSSRFPVMNEHTL